MNGVYFPSVTYEENDDIREERIENKIDNILINNIGKSITLYCCFDNNNEFNGRLEYINENYIVINNIENGNYFFIPSKNINYIEFKEKITI